MPRLALTAALLLLPSLAASGRPPERTEVRDRAAAERLRGNSGITLQWIGFDTPARGHLTVSQPAGVIHLSGGQDAADGAGRLRLDGDVVAIAARRFTLRGRIVITDTPDPGRNCVREGDFTFLATGTRRYWRLQQMVACDGLTDYVDIYF